MGGVVLVEPEAPVNRVLHEHPEKPGVPTTVDASSKQPDKVEGPEPVYRILTLELFEQLVKRPDFHISITEEEIRDKSKRDFLAKLIVIIQSSWFIAQCIARAAQGLNLTELELVTLALASLNAVMYFFWWDKPLDVEVPIKIYLSFRLDDVAKHVSECYFSWNLYVSSNMKAGGEPPRFRQSYIHSQFPVSHRRPISCLCRFSSVEGKGT